MSRRELLIGLAVALALRFGFAARSFDGKQVYGDLGFEEIAIALLDTGVYAERTVPPGAPPPPPTAYREPGYTLLIAGLFKLSGRSYWPFIAAQTLASAATVWLACELALLLFGAAAGRLSFWFACFYPYFIYYSAYYFRDTLQAFLMAAALLLILKRGTDRAAAGAGGLSGWLMLTNSAFGPAIAFIAGLCAFGSGRPWRWRRALAFALPVAAMVGVWTVRNLVSMRAFIPTSTFVGVQMYWAFYIPYEILGSDEQQAYLGREGDDTEYQRINRLPEVERNKAFVAAAVRCAKERPLAFVRGCVGRFFGIWRFMPRSRQYTHNTKMVRALALLSDGWIIPLALLGLALGWKRPWMPWLAALLFLITLTFSVSNAPIRYRMTMMPIVLALAGGGAAGLPGLLRRAPPEKPATG